MIDAGSATFARRFLVALGVTAAALLGSWLLMTSTARAHFLSEDSVDGREVRYEDSTKWDDARTWSIYRWRELGRLTIEFDTASTITDLTFGDYYADDGRCGFWDGRTGSDVARYNDRFFNGYSTTDRRACATHEMGHAVRLAHSYSSQVMDSCPVSGCGSVYTYPQSHDRADFFQIW
jgi:hypothetical protein